MTLEAFALASYARDRMAADENLLRKVDTAELISDALLVHGKAEDNRLMPGVGLCRAGLRLFPTVLADSGVVGRDGGSKELLPFDQFPELRARLGQLLGDRPEGWTRDLRVLPVGEGTAYSTPGTGISRGLRTGRVGPHVHWGTGKEGFLTAGHLAQAIGSHVLDMISGATLGTVRWSNDPASSSSKGGFDTAVVEFDPAYSATTGRSSIVAGSGDPLKIAASTRVSDVFGFFTHVTLGVTPIRYHECYATEDDIASPGDSGVEVESSGDVVGMVVGGFPARGMTLVQAIGYQLREIRHHSTFMVSL